MTKLTVEGFRNFFKYYTGEEHQIRAIDELYLDIDADLLQDSATWIKMYRTPSAPAPVVEPEPDISISLSNPLDVPYEYQLDNHSGTGYRECFSSSCAMVARYYGKVKSDDDYNLVRALYGDSTDAQAHVRTLRALQLDAAFITNATTADLKRQIDIGRPTPCGWLHKGMVQYPTGGGHYSVVIGYNDTGWWVHDPNGEADLVAGGYVDNSIHAGVAVKYSYKNWNPRWIVEGEGSGWMMDIWDPSAKPPVQTTDKQSTAEPGLDLIKHFEGCRLTAYPDPGTGGDPWTIGYGHTGPDVYPGVTITQAEADHLLKQDLKRFEDAVNRLIEVPFNQNEFDATVSFTYNCGAGALESSTFRRRINAGEDKATCFREEFPKWVNGGNGPMPGLVRRREAEVQLATS